MSNYLYLSFYNASFFLDLLYKFILKQLKKKLVCNNSSTKNSIKQQHSQKKTTKINIYIYIYIYKYLYISTKFIYIYFFWLYFSSIYKPVLGLYVNTRLIFSILFKLNMRLL